MVGCTVGCGLIMRTDRYSIGSRYLVLVVLPVGYHSLCAANFEEGRIASYGALRGRLLHTPREARQYPPLASGYARGGSKPVALNWRLFWARPAP